MRAISVAEVNPIKIALFAALLLPPVLHNTRATTSVRTGDNLKAAHEAYEAGDDPKAAHLLQAPAAQIPRDSEIRHFRAKTYYESQQHDAAISSAEKAVAL